MYDAIVVGGGFFGCSLALMLARPGARIAVLERDPGLLMRASTNNQARVHNGYHYPRSILTGLRSRVNYPRFCEEFAGCVDRTFRHYYAIARRQSHVTARQFETFCRRIGAPLSKPPPEVLRWFAPGLIEAVYEVEEIAFDAGKLREALRERLRAAGVEVRLLAEVRAIRGAMDGTGAGLSVTLSTGQTLAARQVFNCTYSSLNGVLAAAGDEVIPLRHELAELCLVEVPEVLRHSGVTVMCGPFFSLMPSPAQGAHSFSHVRYTPHCAWEERGHAAARELDIAPRDQDLATRDQDLAPRDQDLATRDQDLATRDHALAPPRHSRFEHMKLDARRYLPALSGLRHLRSLWEVKTVLPQSEHNDSRPILFKRSARLPGLVSVMGGKLDNVYDLPRELALLASS